MSWCGEDIAFAILATLLKLKRYTVYICTDKQVLIVGLLLYIL
jgi:hypothetical protein